MAEKKNNIDLGLLLDKVLTDFPPIKRTKTDPVQFPRWFFEQGRSLPEIEAVAVYSAMLAYGSAAQFIKKIDQTMVNCQNLFLNAIRQPTPSTEWPGYRLSTAQEVKRFALALGKLLSKHKNLKSIFLTGYLPQKDIKSGLAALHAKLEAEVKSDGLPLTRGIKHLMPNPLSGGCVKRWHMFLRWMVRPEDGVDMGLWTEVSPADLLIPLDRHISRIARNLGLTTRASDDWKTASEISTALKTYSPHDPIKYDFALCHLGIAGKCNHGKDRSLCQRCILSPACKAC